MQHGDKDTSSLETLENILTQQWRDQINVLDTMAVCITFENIIQSKVRAYLR